MLDLILVLTSLTAVTASSLPLMATWAGVQHISTFTVASYNSWNVHVIDVQENFKENSFQGLP